MTIKTPGRIRLARFKLMSDRCLMTNRRERTKGDLHPGTRMRKRQTPPPACPQERSPGWARVPLREQTSRRRGLQENPEKTFPQSPVKLRSSGDRVLRYPSSGPEPSSPTGAKESYENCRAVETVENQVHFVPADSARVVCPPFPQRLENSFGRSFPQFPQLLRLLTSK